MSTLERLFFLGLKPSWNTATLGLTIFDVHLNLKEVNKIISK
jgi:hypothetical protein